MIGGINRGDIIEKNARRRIYDRDEDDDVSDGDLDDEVLFTTNIIYLTPFHRWKTSTVDSIVPETTTRWEKERRKRQAEQETPVVTQREYPVINLKDWTTSGHLKVAKFILNKDGEYLKKMASTFASKKDIERLYRHQEQSARVQDVKGVDQDDDFASYWLPKLRKAYYIMRSPKSDGKTEAVAIISSARESLSIPNPNLI